MKDSWPFSDVPKTLAYVSEPILEGAAPVLLVTHDKGDGAWQFHSTSTPDLSEATMASLEEILRLDPSIAEIADLPLGGIAFREAPEKPWARSGSS